MTNQSPAESLATHALPALLDAIQKYHSVAAHHCNEVQIQMLAELGRRIRQAEFLLSTIAQLEAEAPGRALTEIFAAMSTQTVRSDAEEGFSALDKMWLHAEAFYWVAHKALMVALASKKYGQYPSRLPGFAGNIRASGVTRVRNSLIEHQYRIEETFSLGGMWKGPVLNGGLGAAGKDGALIADEGVWANATEWAHALTVALNGARVNIVATPK